MTTVSTTIRLVALTLVSVSLVPVTTMAQTPTRVRPTIERLGLGSYFADSLRAGTQRVVTPDRPEARISAEERFPQGALLATRVGPSAVVDTLIASGEIRIVLPDRAFVRTGDATGMLLIPVIIVEGNGLQYDAGSATFRGSIRVGVEDSLNRTATASLPNPLAFFVTGAVDDIAPQDLAVDHTNLPFVPIVLAESAPGESLRLNVRSTLHPDGVDVDIPVDRRTLAMDVSPRRVQGLGLEAATLLLGPAAGSGGVTVRLSSDRGHLDQTALTLDPDGTASTSIRSYWIGTATVRARSVALRDAQAAVEFVFPWLFLAAALLGGLLGGLGKWAVTKRGKAPGKEPPQLGPYLVSGPLLGLIASVAIAVGINVTAFNPTVTTGQAVVFAIAALVGYGGAAVIKVGSK